MIKVLSKQQFDKSMFANIITDDNVDNSLSQWCIISINDYLKDCYFNRDHSNVLRLEFPDLTPKENERYDNEFKLFDEFQAKQIKDFVIKNKNKENWMIHCLAGESRSGTVALYVGRNIDKIDWVDFSKRNNHIKPNKWVQDILNKI